MASINNYKEVNKKVRGWTKEINLIALNARKLTSIKTSPGLFLVEDASIARAELRYK